MLFGFDGKLIYGTGVVWEIVRLFMSDIDRYCEIEFYLIYIHIS